MRGNSGSEHTHACARSHTRTDVNWHTCTQAQERAEIHAQAGTHTHIHTITHSGLTQTQSGGVIQVWVAVSEWDQSPLCVHMIAHACAACVTLTIVISANSARVPSQVSRPCASDGLHARPWPPPLARESGHSCSKATAGVRHPARGCHVSLSPLSCWKRLLRWAEALVGGGARGWDVGEWCRRNGLPRTGTLHRAPPEKRHSHLWRGGNWTSVGSTQMIQENMVQRQEDYLI